MIKKKFAIVGVISAISTIMILSYLSSFSSMNVDSSLTDKKFRVYDSPERMWIENNTVHRIVSVEGQKNSTEIVIPIENLLFDHNYHLNDNNEIISSDILSNPKNQKIYQEIGLFNSSKKIAFVYPIFTQAAYDEYGFYYYYNHICDSKCLTVPIPQEEHGRYTSSIRAAAILSILNYPHITDVDIDKDPSILQKYDRIILLHNEYVTHKEFDAITHHPDVVYLYPNALYAEVKTDYKNNTISLIQGHGYPAGNITNGFDWKYENSKYEYDIQCDNWKFYQIPNGKMLNCYPSYRIFYDKDLLVALKQ